MSAYERILVASPAFLDPGWLPPAADCEELADLREEHERLLAICREALGRVSGEQSKYKYALEQRSEATRNAISKGKSLKNLTTPEPDDSAVQEAQRIYEAACEVLEEFVISAQAEIVERAPTIGRTTDLFLRRAQEKREEARRLLQEADVLEARPKRLQNWVDRYTGRSNLGPITYEALSMPVRIPAPDIFEEIAGLPPATVIDIGSDRITDEELEALHEPA